jgi:hypothetical protein
VVWRWDQTEAGTTIRTSDNCIQIPVIDDFPEGEIRTTPIANTASRTCHNRTVLNPKTESLMDIATWGEVEYTQCLGIEANLTRNFEKLELQLSSGNISVDRAAVILIELTYDPVQMNEYEFDKSLQIVQKLIEKNPVQITGDLVTILSNLLGIDKSVLAAAELKTKSCSRLVEQVHEITETVHMTIGKIK